MARFAGVTFEKCFDVLKNKNIPFEERSALETSEFTTYKLEDIYRTILDELKNDYYLEDKNIKYEDIEPYQLFDYMMTFYYEKICALIKKSNGIDDFMDSTEFFEYTTYREDKFAEFAKKYGIDIYEQANTESIKEYHTENFNIIFDDGKLYLFSNSGDKITIPTLNGENTSITLGRNTEIIKINDKIAAMTSLVQSDPVHNIDMVEELLSMANKKGKREAQLAIDSLRELFIEWILPDRPLRYISQQPLENEEVNDSMLVLFYYEHLIKQKYTEV